MKSNNKITASDHYDRNSNSNEPTIFTNLWPYSIYIKMGKIKLNEIHKCGYLATSVTTRGLAANVLVLVHNAIIMQI